MEYLSSFILLSTYAKTFIYLNGIFELILGAFLILGLFTRITALVLGINLIGIILGLGYNDVAVRDFGLMLITLAIFLVCVILFFRNCILLYFQESFYDPIRFSCFLKLCYTQSLILKKQFQD